jgi:ABC-type sugar transport system ATPase subunit
MHIPERATVVTPLLSAQDISKRFGGVQALDGVSLTVMPGEVHGLLGANGAGKSTLVKVLAGLVRRDSGQIVIDGQHSEIDDPAAAAASGLGFVHQQLSVVPNFSATDNVTLGRESRTRSGLLTPKKSRLRVTNICGSLDPELDIDAQAGNLTIAQQWILSIARCLYQDAKILVLDEPTAALSRRETERFLTSVTRSARRGLGVIFVSHRLGEVEMICDRVTVMRDGCVATTIPKATMNRATIVSAMTGAAAEWSGVAESTRVPAQVPDCPTEGRTRSHTSSLLEVSHISRGELVEDVSLSLHGGEILGIAGLVGSGRTELARMIVGLDQPDTGQIFIDERLTRVRSPYEARRLGIGLVPEDRLSQGLVYTESAMFNLFLGSPQQTMRWSRYLPLISRRKQVRVSNEVANRVGLRPCRTDLDVNQYSGGNQQKIVLGRWLAAGLRILLLDEPTLGVDVGARQEIYVLIRELAKLGLGVLVISSDFEELIACDRVVIMSRGHITGELRGTELSEKALLAASY